MEWWQNVKKNYRDLGIGYHLIDTAIRESKKLNFKEKIILSSFLNNERALNLYQKIGFKKIGVRKKQYYMESKYFDEILMDLWIDDYLKNNAKEWIMCKYTLLQNALYLRIEQ